MRVQFGQRELEMGGPALGELRDSNDLLSNTVELRRRLAEEGYLLVRGLIDRDKVRQTREHILGHMHEQEALTPNTPVLEGVMPANGKTVPMMGRRGVTHHPQVRATLEARELFDFYATLFGESVLTFDYKWLRGVGHEQFTGAHYDAIYMGRGSGNLTTCWLPLGDIPIEQGTLAVCRGSHNLPGFEKLRRTYGRMDVDRDRVDGWFTNDPLEITGKFGGRWLTTNFEMGDILTFGMFTMHASTTNTTDRFRLSCDVRYQPQSEPVDERWVGENPKGHYVWHAEPAKNIPMAEARAAWGV